MRSLYRIKVKPKCTQSTRNSTVPAHMLTIELESSIERITLHKQLLCTALRARAFKPNVDYRLLLNKKIFVLYSLFNIWNGMAMGWWCRWPRASSPDVILFVLVRQYPIPGVTIFDAVHTMHTAQCTCYGTSQEWPHLNT